MNGRIKISVVSLAVALSTLIGSTATLSYFTDTDSAVTSFMIGQAETQLLIYSESDKLEARNFDAGLPSTYDQFLSNNALIPGVERKMMLMAKNTGNIPVYQRFRVLIPKGLVDSGKFLYAVGCSGRNDAQKPASCSGIEYEFSTSLNKSIVAKLKDDNVEYYALTMTRLNRLEVGAWTANPPLEYVRLNGDTDDAWISAAKTAGWITADGKLNIHVYSEAVQAEGFANASIAFQHFVPTYTE